MAELRRGSAQGPARRPGVRRQAQAVDGRHGGARRRRARHRGGPLPQPPAGGCPSPRSSGPRWRRPEREPAAAVGARSPEIALSGVPARSKPAECNLADAQSGSHRGGVPAESAPVAASTRAWPTARSQQAPAPHRSRAPRPGDPAADPGPPRPRRCAPAPRAAAPRAAGRGAGPEPAPVLALRSGPITRATPACPPDAWQVSARRRRAATQDRPGPTPAPRCRCCARPSRRTTHQSPASTAPAASTARVPPWPRTPPCP